MVNGLTAPRGARLLRTNRELAREGKFDVTDRVFAAIRLARPDLANRLNREQLLQRFFNAGVKGSRVFSNTPNPSLLARQGRVGGAILNVGFPGSFLQPVRERLVTERGGKQAVEAFKRREKIAEKRAEEVIKTGKIPPSLAPIGTTERFVIQRRVRAAQDAAAVVARLKREQERSEKRQATISQFAKEISVSDREKTIRKLRGEVTSGKVKTKTGVGNLPKVIGGKKIPFVNAFVRPSDKSIPPEQRIINNVRFLSNLIQDAIFNVSKQIFVTLGVDGPNFVVQRIPSGARERIKQSIINIPAPRFSDLGLPIGLSKIIIRGAETKLFTLKDFRKIAGSAGGTIGGIGSVFISGVPGAIAKVTAIGASDDQAGTALAFGTGVAFGGVSKVIGGGSKLLKLKLGTGKTGKAWLVVEKIGTKLVPAFFVYEGSVSAIDIGKAIATGNEAAVRRKTKRAAAGLAAFQVGARVGTTVGARLGKKIDQAILFRQFEKVVAKKYGRGSKTYNQSIKAFGDVFGKIPRGAEVTQAFNAKFVESISKSPKAIRVVNKVLRENANDFVIIGSGVIVPQAGLKAPPRKLIGDIDANSVKGAAAAKRIATQMFRGLRRAGFSSKQTRLVTRRFAGEAKFSVDFRLRGKGPWQELFNIAESPKTTFFQIEKIVNTLDLPPQTAFRKDKFGVQLLNLRDQLRVKVTGFATGGRLKDLPDIIKGSRAFLRKGTPKQRATGNKLIRDFRKAKTATKRNSIINQFRKLLNAIKEKVTGKKKPKIVVKKESAKVKKLREKLSKAKTKKQRTKIFKDIRKAKLKEKRKVGVKKKPSRQPRINRSSIVPFISSPILTLGDPSRPRRKPSRPRRGKPSRPPSKPPRPPKRKIPSRPPSKPPRPPTRKTPLKPPKPPSRPPFTPPKPPSRPPFGPPRPPRKPPSPPSKPPFPPEKPTKAILRASFQSQVKFLSGSKRPFNVLVRTKIGGKLRFVRKNTRPLTGRSALALGGKLTGGDPRRSFFIDFAKGKKAFGLNLPPFKIGQYRKPIGKTKLPLFTFVEKSEFAINEPGERRGITAKGIAAQRRKKFVRRIKQVVRTRRKPILRKRRVVRRRPVRRKIVVKRRRRKSFFDI